MPPIVSYSNRIQNNEAIERTEGLGDLEGLSARLGDTTARGLDALLLEKIHGHVLVDGQETLLLGSRVHAGLKER